jgi:hypothetical protein
MELGRKLGCQECKQTDKFNGGCGLQSREGARKTAMTTKNFNARRHWYRRWRWFSFHDVVFTDEKSVCLRGDGPSRCWRRKGDRFTQRCIRPADKFGGGGLMVCGSITRAGVRPLTRVHGKLDGAYLRMWISSRRLSAHYQGCTYADARQPRSG